MVLVGFQQILLLAIHADLLVALRGNVLLAEFPELCGVEQNLIDRCTTEASAKKFIDLDAILRCFGT